MLTELKLLHAYIGGLIEEVEGGHVELNQLFDNRDPDSLSVDLTFTRKAVAAGCDHEYRRIASGEYECGTCGSITDEPEGEQWA
jgi:hypothetical protein